MAVGFLLSRRRAPPATILRTITFNYDPLSRLTDASYTTGESFLYTYDSVGNRLTETDSSGTTNYAYDTANCLSSVGGVSFTWGGEDIPHLWKGASQQAELKRAGLKAAPTANTRKQIQLKK